jgi:hypothetical protein
MVDVLAPPSLGDFLAARDALAALFGRDVDLIVDGVVRNRHRIWPREFPNWAVCWLNWKRD